MAGVGSEPRDLPSFIRDVRKRITALERRLIREQSTPTPVLDYGRGSTAERDTYFGTPSAGPEQAALANRQPYWFNTDKGFAEMYYAPDTLSGLTTRGLLPGHVAGWYPVAGSDLYAIRGKTNGFQSLTAGANLDVVLGAVLQNRGGFTSASNSGLTVPVGGLYEVRASAYFSGPASAAVYVNALHNSTLYGSNVSKPTGADVTVSRSVTLPVAAGQSVFLQALTITATSVWGTTGYDGCRLEMLYTGPPLVDG